MYLDVIFDTLLIMHKPTNGKPVFFFFLFERYGRYKYPKNAKTPVCCVKKIRRKKPGFPFVCTCGLTTALKFQIEILKNDRGIAEMPFSQLLS